jgi:nicotinamidase-related amidase
VLRLGSDLAALDPRLQAGPQDTLVIKKYASAFFGTSLAATLTAAGVDTVLVAGATTSGCVRASVVDALQCQRPRPKGRGLRYYERKPTLTRLSQGAIR